MTSPRHHRAIADLEWLVCSDAAVMGLHAQSLDGGTSAAWDGTRLQRLHDGRLTVGHRANVARYRRVADLVTRLPLEGQLALKLTFSARIGPKQRKHAGRVGTGGSLAGVIAMLDATNELWRAASDRSSLSEYLEAIAEGAAYERLDAEARTLFEEAVLAPYETLAREQAAAAKAARDVELRRLRTGT